MTPRLWKSVGRMNGAAEQGRDQAQEERVTRARVTQIMSLLDLPEDVKVKLLEDDEEARGMSIREALRTAAG